MASLVKVTWQMMLHLIGWMKLFGTVSVFCIFPSRWLRKLSLPPSANSCRLSALNFPLCLSFFWSPLPTWPTLTVPSGSTAGLKKRACEMIYAICTFLSVIILNCYSHGFKPFKNAIWRCHFRQNVKAVTQMEWQKHPRSHPHPPIIYSCQLSPVCLSFGLREEAWGEFKPVTFLSWGNSSNCCTPLCFYPQGAVDWMEKSTPGLWYFPKNAWWGHEQMCFQWSPQPASQKGLYCINPPASPTLSTTTSFVFEQRICQKKTKKPYQMFDA